MGILKPFVVGKETSFNDQRLRVKTKPRESGSVHVEFGSRRGTGNKRFLCSYAGRTAQVKSDPKGWILRWQCLTRIAPDDDWDGEIKRSTRLCEAAEAALRKAEEILLIEWQVSL